MLNVNENCDKVKNAEFWRAYFSSKQMKMLFGTDEAAIDYGLLSSTLLEKMVHLRTLFWFFFCPVGSTLLPERF